MKRRRTLHYYRPGALTGLEAALNAMSRGGWQALRPGRFLQVYEQGAGCFLHRFDYCPDRPGSADKRRFLASRERAGWTLAARRGGWLLYCRPAEETEPDAALPEGRDRIRALFARRIARLEGLRRWMLVLASGLLIGGYVSSLLPVLYATALPLAVALFVTYRIKFMEEMT
ncbi:MAG: hypothetical protein IJK24_02325 [Oscillospiraceae bacterium]|nr:hypothetical protein [Oscillospiraceae bacterium]MBQ6159763.1 hypothetical protein [Oscillospiraceae bacterium]